jgi:hypothetical protein
MGIFAVDEGLRRLGDREKIERDEVIDILLDVRQSLDRYYITSRPREEMEL